ncbi:hypothetical protein FACS1894214_4330 [Planctomycetales bacterium]|nr:hypothetical protein FACS1894214_4330 [Planctomycetales bacterium]
MKRLSLFIVNYSLFILFLSGCGGAERPANLPKLYPTSITLTQEGKPLVNAMVMLYSADADFKWSVAGITNASGTAEIKTHGKFSGSPLGEYKVAVSKTENPNQGESFDDTEEGQKKRAAAKRQSVAVIYNLVEKQYMERDTTPLLIKIEKGKNRQTFDAGKAVRIEDKVEL